METAVLISGGVDSSVALARLVREGRPVRAFYLRIWLEDDAAQLGQCPAEEDLEYVRAVCDRFEVPLEVVPLQREYRERVVDYTIDELRAGRTPSPDLFCNERIKFGAFLEAVPREFDRVATGHYARIDRSSGRAQLRKGVDPVKDQTYFLAHLSREQLERCEFPLGADQKSAIREEAESLELPNRHRPDSQGICFLGSIKFDDFARYYLGEQPGPIVDVSTGRELGTHPGYWFLTIGQRKGLGLSGGPWFVVDKNPERNEVRVCHADVHSDFRRDRFTVSSPHWIEPAPKPGQPLSVKLRHGPQVVDARIEPRDGETWVSLGQPDPGVAPGQFAIFYDDDLCLGAAAIDRVPLPGPDQDEVRVAP